MSALRDPLRARDVVARIVHEALSLPAEPWTSGAARAFDARERFRLTDQEGRVAHAELEIYGGLVMLAEEFPDYNTSPQSLGKTTVILSIRVPNVTRPTGSC